MKMVAPVRNCHLHLIRAEVLSLVVLVDGSKAVTAYFIMEEASAAEIVIL